MLVFGYEPRRRRSDGVDVLRNAPMPAGGLRTANGKESPQAKQVCAEQHELQRAHRPATALGGPLRPRGYMSRGRGLFKNLRRAESRSDRRQPGPYASRGRGRKLLDQHDHRGDFDEHAPQQAAARQAVGPAKDVRVGRRGVDAVDVGLNVAGLLVAASRLFLQRLIDDVVQPRIDVSLGRWRQKSADRQLARQHFVEHHAER